MTSYECIVAEYYYARYAIETNPDNRWARLYREYAPTDTSMYYTFMKNWDDGYLDRWLARLNA